MGCGEKVKTTGRRPFFFASSVRTLRIFWCPKWTPSKFPMATDVFLGKEGKFVKFFIICIYL